MGSQMLRSSSGRSPRWLRKKSKKTEPSASPEVSDSEPEEYLSHSFVGSRGLQPSGLTHELRIFVGTWNVGGKSPVGSLAADLEEWLNLKSSVDMYVLGFQEIVPLNTKSVIGMEDYTDARKWNLLVGKTLNNREGCVWLSSTLTPLTNDEYQYAKPENSGRQTRLRRSTTPLRERSNPQQGEQDGSSNAYKMMASKKMVGVFLTIWIKRDLLRKYRFSNVKATPVACGLMGYLGNKGAVSVSMSIDGTSFCFVTAHLASGEKKGDELRRNQQVGEIFKRTVFPRLPLEIEDTLPLTILGHERIFLFGDLNYRLCMEDNRARELIRQKKWKELQKFDQLKKEQQHRGVFQGWREGDIEFAPTYKYSVELGNRYTGDKHSPLLPNSAEKRRTPAWCDRIMWFGKGVEQLSYFRGESKFSDHRPVSALFITEIDVLKPANSKTAALPLSKFLASMNLSKYNTPMQVQCSNKSSTLLSLIKAETEGSASGKALTVDNRQ
ncbi:type I inositol polyphosphate 5-phosphatase 8-like [Silene latifolia]|uniref:type I inositol polyphosphate 5-phosphatase 8-like n=1 Tax=Silene latifolia TaxID=37657 RepID=UPI003D78445C